MNRTTLSALALAAATLLSANVMAADGNTAKTRAQVRTELSDAIRSGDIVLNVETGQSLNQMEPGRYPAKEAEAGKTREQVKAELAVAIRTGNLIVNV